MRQQVMWFVLGLLAGTVITLVWLPYYAWAKWRYHKIRYVTAHFLRDWAGTSLIQGIVWLVMGQTSSASPGQTPGLWIGAFTSAAIALLIRWFRRKPRKVAGLVGDKSRMLRDALVETMRGERRPGGVLRPGEG